MIYFPGAGLILSLFSGSTRQLSTIGLLGGIWQFTLDHGCITNFRRGYAEAKLQENLDSEIMEVILEEAREAFDAEIVVELTSNTSEEMESNVERIEAWIKEWNKDNKIGL